MEIIMKPRKPNYHNVTVRIIDDIYKELVKLAKETGKKPAAIAREGIVERVGRGA